ncbi:MAG: family 43 glycosylhydrolase [Dysgonomonas sp.]
MNKISLILIFSLFLANVHGQQKTFKNPVIRGDMADPSIVRIDDVYYATGTSSEWAPFYPVFKSKDLVNWEQTGHIFDKQPEWTSSSFWAPELYHHKNGKVYCYYTARRKSDNVSYIGVATANSMNDKFTDHGLLVEFGTEAIDAFIYDDKGQLYITWKAYGLDNRPIEIVGSKLSDDGLKLEGKVFSLLKDDERIGMEGQYHFKQGDYYYIVYSPHGCCGPGSDYDVYVARSKKFKGPYEKYEGNPILHGGGGDFISSGHGTTVTTPDGRMYYMCHAYLRGDGFYAGRQPILQEMYVGDDNWVHFRTGNVTKVEQPMPFANTTQKDVVNFEDNFQDGKLKIDWTWNYGYANVNTVIKERKLYLSGTPKSENRFGSALCLRPATPHYSYETLLADKNKSLKGLTMYGDDKNLVVWGNLGNEIVLKSVKDGQEVILYGAAVTESVYLKIEVTGGCFLDFFMSKDGKEWIKVNDKSIDFGYLVRWDRIARPGLIHIGEIDTPAVFSYFKLDNLK